MLLGLLPLILPLSTSFTHTQKYEDESSTTRRQEPAAGQVLSSTLPCATVELAVASIEASGSVEGMIKMDLGAGKFGTYSTTSSVYYKTKDTFGLEKIQLDGKHGVAYDVSCETAGCNGPDDPDYECPVVEVSALSEGNVFEEGFDGAADLLAAAAERAGVVNRRMLSCKNSNDQVHCNPAPGGEPGGVVWAKGKGGGGGR